MATRAANAWGFHDLLGNAWEWCADGYAPYPHGALVDPVAPIGAAARHARRVVVLAASDGARGAKAPGERLPWLGVRFAAAP